MIDIKGELLRLENQRKQEYISIIELLDCIKAHNQNVSFQEIATYLLIKLTPNDVRKTDDQIWGQEDYEEWVRANGIEVFYVPESLDCLPENRFSDLFFETLEDVKEFNDITPYLLFDSEEDKAEYYLKEDQKTLFVKRERIENLLGIKTIDPQKQKALEDELAQKQFTAVAMALTKTDEFVKNTDINKSPTGLAERLIYEERLAEKDKRIAELENQLENKSAVNYDECSIYGHTTIEIKAIFAVIQRYWINHDIKQPDTIANADDIKKWIRENFPNISNTNAEAIQKITRPLEAKFIGRKEKG